jgi:hypothetical protein
MKRKGTSGSSGSRTGIILPAQNIQTVDDLNAYMLELRNAILIDAAKGFDYKKAIKDKMWQASKSSDISDSEIEYVNHPDNKDIMVGKKYSSSEEYKASAIFAKRCEESYNKLVAANGGNPLIPNLPKEFFSSDVLDAEIKDLTNILNALFKAQFTSLREIAKGSGNQTPRLRGNPTFPELFLKYGDKKIGLGNKYQKDAGGLLRVYKGDSNIATGVYWQLDIALGAFREVTANYTKSFSAKEKLNERADALIRETIREPLENVLQEKGWSKEASEKLAKELSLEIYKKYPFISIHGDSPFVQELPNIMSRMDLTKFKTDEDKIKAIMENTENNAFFRKASLENIDKTLVVLKSSFALGVMPQVSAAESAEQKKADLATAITKLDALKAEYKAADKGKNPAAEKTITPSFSNAGSGRNSIDTVRAGDNEIDESAKRPLGSEEKNKGTPMKGTLDASATVAANSKHSSSNSMDDSDKTSGSTPGSGSSTPKISSKPKIDIDEEIKTGDNPFAEKQITDDVTTAKKVFQRSLTKEDGEIDNIQRIMQAGGQNDATLKDIKKSKQAILKFVNSDDFKKMSIPSYLENGGKHGIHLPEPKVFVQQINNVINSLEDDKAKITAVAAVIILYVEHLAGQHKDSSHPLQFYTGVKKISNEKNSMPDSESLVPYAITLGLGDFSKQEYLRITPEVLAEKKSEQSTIPAPAKVADDLHKAQNTNKNARTAGKAILAVGVVATMGLPLLARKGKDLYDEHKTAEAVKSFKSSYPTMEQHPTSGQKKTIAEQDKDIAARIVAESFKAAFKKNGIPEDTKPENVINSKKLAELNLNVAQAVKASRVNTSGNVHQDERTEHLTSLLTIKLTDAIQNNRNNDRIYHRRKGGDKHVHLGSALDNIDLQAELSRFNVSDKKKENFASNIINHENKGAPSANASTSFSAAKPPVTADAKKRHDELYARYTTDALPKNAGAFPVNNPTSAYTTDGASAEKEAPSVSAPVSGSKTPGAINQQSLYTTDDASAVKEASSFSNPTFVSKTKPQGPIDVAKARKALYERYAKDASALPTSNPAAVIEDGAKAKAAIEKVHQKDLSWQELEKMGLTKVREGKDDPSKPTISRN